MKIFLGGGDKFPIFAKILDMKDEKRKEARLRMGSYIATIREQWHLTQAQVAERAGITVSNLVRIEQGRYNVGIDELQAIANVFGMDVELVLKQQ